MSRALTEASITDHAIGPSDDEIDLAIDDLLLRAGSENIRSEFDSEEAEDMEYD